MVELLDRFRGCLVGLAVGDALGHPTEFIPSVADIKRRYGPRGIVDFDGVGRHPPGTFTDDTQMTIAVARALTRAGHRDRDTLMTLLGEEFVAWSLHPSNNRAPGGTCLAGCRHLQQGASWKDAGVKGSKGCGAAMRAAPVGLYAFDDDDALLRLAAAQSVLTHSHPTAIASSVAAAAPVAWLLRGNGIDGIVDFTRKLVQRVDEDLLRELGVESHAASTIGNREQLERLDRLEAVLDKDTDDVCSLLGGAWIGEEAVVTALWCFIKAKGDFSESIRRGAVSSGDSDSIACIAGSFAGALHGYSGLHSTLTTRVERHDDLVMLADALHAARTGGDSALPARLDFFGADARADAPFSMNDGDDSDNADDSDNGSILAVNDDAEIVVPVVVSEAGETAANESDVDVDALEAEVQRHNEHYWVHSAPQITDQAFDALTRRLKLLKPDSPALAHLGPRSEGDRAVRHTQPMRSLDKCYDDEALLAWTADFNGDVVVMPKIDGLACVLHYDDDGQLVLAATRGDGEVGENVTANVKAIADVPRRVAAGPLEVRGEVYLSLPRFEALKAEALKNLDELPKNPRNAAAGALRQKDPHKTRAIGLSFLAYDLRGTASTSHREKLAMLAGLGFAPIPQAVAPKSLIKVAVDALAERRSALPYETDGVVVIVDDVEEADRLGATSHHPRYAIAWKFQGEEGESVLRGVQWQVARTGTITPVAIVDPVELSGVTVTRATLHHRGFLDKLGLTIGAKLAMVRRGGVIPHVERVLTPGDGPIVIPQLCPSCGAAVISEGDFLLCGEPQNCVAARVGRLIHWGKNVDIIGLGESVAEQLIESGLVKTPADLYTLTRAQLVGLDRLGPTLADKLITEIDKTRQLDVDVLLRGLGIEGLGKTVARQLAEKFITLPRLRSATRGELASLKGFGDVSAAAIVHGLKDNSDLVDRLLAQITVRGSAPSAASGPLAGQSFVFTGALSLDRASAEARVRALGGQTPSSVTKALTHLVVGGGRGAPSTKQKAAEKLIADGAPIAILDEAAFAAVIDRATRTADPATIEATADESLLEPVAPVLPPPDALAATSRSVIEDAPSRASDEAADPRAVREDEAPLQQKRVQLTLF